MNEATGHFFRTLVHLKIVLGLHAPALFRLLSTRTKCLNLVLLTPEWMLLFGLNPPCSVSILNAAEAVPPFKFGPRGRASGMLYLRVQGSQLP